MHLQISLVLQSESKFKAFGTVRKLPEDCRKGSSCSRTGHGLEVHVRVITTCVLSLPLSLCVCVCVAVRAMCVPTGVCVAACGSSQTDIRRGGRAEG